MPSAEIADRLGRDSSTIYYDIKRNRYSDKEMPELNGYHALVAQDMYEERCDIHRKMILHPELKAAVAGNVATAGTIGCTYLTRRAYPTGLNASRIARRSATGSAI